jgi:hypothetical protein
MILEAYICSTDKNLDAEEGFRKLAQKHEYYTTSQFKLILIPTPTTCFLIFFWLYVTHGHIDSSIFVVNNNTTVSDVIDGCASDLITSGDINPFHFWESLQRIHQTFYLCLFVCMYVFILYICNVMMGSTYRAVRTCCNTKLLSIYIYKFIYIL